MSGDGLKEYAQTDEIEIWDCTELMIVKLEKGRCSPIDFDEIQRWQVNTTTATLGIPSHLIKDTAVYSIKQKIKKLDDGSIVVTRPRIERVEPEAHDEDR